MLTPWPLIFIILSYISATGELTPSDIYESASPGYKKLSGESETPTPRTPRSAKFDDNMFFGKSFNLDTLADTAVSSEYY